MNKSLMIALALATMSPALAAAPNTSFQVQSTAATTGTSTTPGAAVDNAAAATGNAVNDAVDPDKSVDTNNDGVAGTRQFLWGLLGLIGLIGLFGRRPTPVVLADTSRRDSVSGLGTSTADRR